jgi:hypothetical protein
MLGGALADSAELKMPSIEQAGYKWMLMAVYPYDTHVPNEAA